MTQRNEKYICHTCSAPYWVVEVDGMAHGFCGACTPKHVRRVKMTVPEHREKLGWRWRK